MVAGLSDLNFMNRRQNTSLLPYVNPSSHEAALRTHRMEAMCQGRTTDAL